MKKTAVSLSKVYIDTTILKFSATQLPRLRPRKSLINWGNRTHEVVVHDFVYINPNDFIDNDDLKAETMLLPTLAKAGKHGQVKYVIQIETLLESWGLPKMDSETGKFYGAPLECIESPIKYSRIIFGFSFGAKELQFNFLSSIKNKRFLELQKMTGAYQGPGKVNRNQLLDAFHLWCAEYNKCDYFLTLDFKLVNILRKQKHYLSLEVLKPSELIRNIGIRT